MRRSFLWESTLQTDRRVESDEIVTGYWHESQWLLHSYMVVPYLRKWKAWPLYYVLDSCYHMDLCWFVVRLWVCYYYIWVNTGFNSIRVKKKKHGFGGFTLTSSRHVPCLLPEALRSVVLPSFKWFLILSPDWIPISYPVFNSMTVPRCLLCGLLCACGNWVTKRTNWIADEQWHAVPRDNMKQSRSVGVQAFFPVHKPGTGREALHVANWK